jgi:hypothetical protein
VSLERVHIKMGSRKRRRGLGAFGSAIAFVVLAAACGGSKHPSDAEEDAGPTSVVSNDASSSSVVPEAAPATCIDYGPGTPATGCRCALTREMITVFVACGVALCESTTTEVIYCTNDGVIGYLENIPFTTCSALRPCDNGDSGTDAAGNPDDASPDSGDF